MASNLSARLRKLESCVLLLGEMHGRLQYIQPTVQSLISALAAQQRFGGLPFLRECAQLMLKGRDFSSSWREALKKQTSALGKEEAAVLSSLGDVLGQSDLQSQLAAIDLARGQLEQRIDGAREKMAAQGSLYRSIGALGGAAAAIILI